MSIVVSEDVVNGGDITMVVGVVDQISFKEIPGGADRFGNTHRAGVRIGDDWVNNINIKVKEGFDPQVRFNAGNQADPDWQNLEVGDDVKLVVTPNEYNGKTYYNGAVSKIRLVKKGSGAPAQAKPAGGQKQGDTFQKKDFTGVEVGHAINAALNFMEDVDFDNSGEIVETAKLFHTLTVKMKEAHAKANPKMSDYDVGASVGHAVLNASKLAGDMESVETFAQAILDNVVNPVFDFVRESAKKEEKPKPAAKAATKRASKTATKPKAEPAPEPEQPASPNFDDMDDDIPF